jgi:hypothetical protein
MESLDLDVVQDFGVKLGNLFCFWNCCCGPNWEHQILEVVYIMIYGLNCIIFFINVFKFFSLKLIGSFAMTLGGGLTLSKLSIKPLT